MDLITQLRRDTLIIAGNVAESAAKENDSEKLMFVNYAERSAREVDAYIEMSGVQFGCHAQFDDCLSKLQKLSMMLRVLRKSIERGDD